MYVKNEIRKTLLCIYSFEGYPSKISVTRKMCKKNKTIFSLFFSLLHIFGIYVVTMDILHAYDLNLGYNDLIDV